MKNWAMFAAAMALGVPVVLASAWAVFRLRADLIPVSGRKDGASIRFIRLGVLIGAALPLLAAARLWWTWNFSSEGLTGRIMLLLADLLDLVLAGLGLAGLCFLVFGAWRRQGEGRDAPDGDEDLGDRLLLSYDDDPALAETILANRRHGRAAGESLRRGLAESRRLTESLLPPVRAGVMRMAAALDGRPGHEPKVELLPDWMDGMPAIIIGRFAIYAQAGDPAPEPDADEWPTEWVVDEVARAIDEYDDLVPLADSVEAYRGESSSVALDTLFAALGRRLAEDGRTAAGTPDDDDGRGR